MSRMSYQATSVAQVDDGHTPTHSDLCLRPLNVEKGDKRFCEEDFPPLAATWRSNLTALSQRRNLLFVAYNHQIYVWEPAGPRQVLGAKPTMIITPVMKEPDAGGYISRQFPHAINNIIVDDLGRDEILLLATDSGNICGYHVETIFSDIERARLNGEKDSFLNQQIDPFFCENVGASAWGLAVHKYARLIAVSANSGLITVFAFALAEPRSENSEDSGCPSGLIDDSQNYGQNWLYVEKDEQFEQLRQLIPNNYRSHNVRLSYRGHCTNIPCVTFFNSDLDSDGMWMLSTDINNRMFVWTIWDKLTPFKEFNFSRGEPLPDILRREELGWSVLALDPRSFRKREFYAQACGGRPYLRPSYRHAVLDVTHLSQYVPDSSDLYGVFPPAVRLDVNEPTVPDIFDNESSIRVSSDNDLTFHTETTTSSSSPDQEVSELGQSISDNVDWNPAEQRETNAASILFANNDQYSFIWEEEEISEDNEDESSPDTYDPEDMEDGILYVMASTMENDDEMSDENLDSPGLKDTCTEFPILHFSETDIRLFESQVSRYPTVVCGGPLRQHFTRAIYSIHSYDRFNMVKYLPEHGIVIAATQKGRAAVISLAQVSNGGLALRINWMLPLASQERHGERPLMPLLGLAVGPIQGFEKKPDVPDVPYKTSDRHDFSFHYRFQGAGEADSCDNVSTWGNSCQERSSDEEGEKGVDISDDSSAPDSEASVNTPDLTYAECYGTANWVYQPCESWQGWNSSRRYRLLLTYGDHTVLSYEFWYGWSEAVLGNHSSARDDRVEDFLLL